jgi:hypothetical protein
MGAVEPKVTTVRAWNGTPETAKEPFPQLSVPLAGFSIIEAEVSLPRSSRATGANRRATQNLQYCLGEVCRDL